MLQRTEMVRRIADEIEGYIVELGVDGRLVRLQLEELMGEVDDDRRLVIQDYLPECSGRNVDEALAALAELEHRGAARPARGGRAGASGCAGTDLDDSVQPRGYRLLARVPRLPEGVVERIVDRFGSLQKILRATRRELATSPASTRSGPRDQGRASPASPRTSTPGPHTSG